MVICHWVRQLTGTWHHVGIPWRTTRLVSCAHAVAAPAAALFDGEKFVRMTKLRLAAVVLVMTAAVGAFASPAYASGTTLNEEWSKNPELCETSCVVTQGNIVQLWQGILWVQGFGSGSCSSFVDGHFGPNTTTATRAYQSAKNLGIDGRVGPQTWTYVEGLLLDGGGGNGTEFWYIGGSRGSRGRVNVPYDGINEIWKYNVVTTQDGGGGGYNNTGWPTIGPKVGCYT